MIVLCVGMIRSGSTWSYNAALDLMAKAGKTVAAGGYSEILGPWLGSLPANASGVIKTHKLDAAAAIAVSSSNRKVGALFSYRGAGPAIASAIRAFDLDFESQAGAIEQAITTLRLVQSLWPVMILPFEHVGSIPTVEALASFLGLEPSSTQIADVALRNSRDNVSSRLSQTDWHETASIYRDDRYVFQRATLLHRTHISDPEMARARFELTPERVSRLESLADLYRESGLEVGSDFFSNVD